jgi:hypothetical protein
MYVNAAFSETVNPWTFTDEKLDHMKLNEAKIYLNS